MSEVACLDHVGMVAKDLAPMLDAVRRLGFCPTEPRPLLGRDPATGATVPLGQSSAHLVFGAGYVELSAVHSSSSSHHLAPWLRAGPGLHILAFGAGDARDAHARCESAGLAPLPLRQASREIAYGERHGEARFEWFMLPPAETPEALVCFVRQVTPELVFQPAVERHDNGASALEGVYLVCEKPEALATRYAAMTGAMRRGGEVALEGGWIRCLDPAGFDARFPGLGAPRVPSVAGFAIRVAALGSVGRCLAAGQVQGYDAPGRTWVAPIEGLPAVVEFRE
jgi:hypothetical protein